MVGRPQLSERIDVADLSVRARKRLWQAGIDTWAQLENTSNEELLRIRGLGKTTLRELRRYQKYRKNE
ncbi:MAG: DNA-directed RNA polymerase subunit alpha C-terminal domain-containing protein [Planctomycetota bacterium]